MQIVGCGAHARDHSYKVFAMLNFRRLGKEHTLPSDVQCCACSPGGLTASVVSAVRAHKLCIRWFRFGDQSYVIEVTALARARSDEKEASPQEFWLRTLSAVGLSPLMAQKMRIFGFSPSCYELDVSFTACRAHEGGSLSRRRRRRRALARRPPTMCAHTTQLAAPLSCR